MLLKSKYNFTFYSIFLLYILVSSILIYIEKFEFILIIPLVLVVFFVLVRSFDKIFYLIAFLTPLSVNLSYIKPQLPVEVSLFTEPLLVLLLFIIFIRFLKNHKIDTYVLKHPVSLSIILLLIWTFISAITSTMPLVSIKFFISKLWLIIPVFYIGLMLFRNLSKIKSFITIHIIGVIIIVVYSTFQLVFDNILSKNAIHFAVQPFYNDHTAYGAILALMIPVAIGLIFIYKQATIKLILIFASILLIMGVVLSYSRASWLGLLIALAIFILIKFRIKFVYVFISALLIFAVMFTFWFQIIDKLEKNNQDSSANFSHHISSITNISTDASNVERLNRWLCAVEMFKEKPVFGWGPGTYQFQYAPFQLERMRTIISTNFGEVGNAHSEYLGPLAEQGLAGSLFFLLLTTTILFTGFKTYYGTKNKEVKILALTITLGFITYFFHGLLNNFLDTDKLSVPFFGLASILMSLDLFHKEEVI